MLNQIILMGRLTQDPILRTTQAGISVSSFRIAVDRDYVIRGGERQTDFIDCVAWRQSGEFVNRYFHKGSMIVVTGRLQSRKWEDQSGNARISWEVQVSDVHFGEGKKGMSASEQSDLNPDETPFSPSRECSASSDEDNLPF